MVYFLTHFLDLLQQIQQSDWSKANEIEQFLTIFYETVKEFGSTKEPMFQKCVIECLALLHELQQANDSNDSNHSEQAGVKLESSKSINSNKCFEDLSSWSQTISRKAEQLLDKWLKENLKPEHYMGTVLEPRFKQLQLICKDIEK